MPSRPNSPKQNKESLPSKSASSTRAKQSRNSQLIPLHLVPPLLWPKTNLKYQTPPMFNGERRALLPFLAKCRLKFIGQPSSFPTEAAKVIYAGSCLKGPPFSWFSPLNDRLQDPEEKDPTELLTFDSLAKHLTTLYGDPHLALTAERKLRTLR